MSIFETLVILLMTAGMVAFIWFIYKLQAVIPTLIKKEPGIKEVPYKTEPKPVKVDDFREDLEDRTIGGNTEVSSVELYMTNHVSNVSAKEAFNKLMRGDE